jgi:hypothetical protein
VLLASSISIHGDAATRRSGEYDGGASAVVTSRVTSTIMASNHLALVNGTKRRSVDGAIAGKTTLWWSTSTR